MAYYNEKLETMSLNDLIALKGHLVNDRMKHWGTLWAESSAQGEESSEYWERMQLCKKISESIESIIADRIHAIEPEYDI